jgi:hypothetical protein
MKVPRTPIRNWKFVRPTKSWKDTFFIFLSKISQLLQKYLQYLIKIYEFQSYGFVEQNASEPSSLYELHQNVSLSYNKKEVWHFNMRIIYTCFNKSHIYCQIKWSSVDSFQHENKQVSNQLKWHLTLNETPTYFYTFCTT